MKNLVPVKDNLNNHIEQFIGSLDNVSERTTEEYQKNIRYFMEWYQNSNRNFDTNILRDYRDELKEKGLSVFTINTYLNSIQRFCDHLFMLRLLPVKLDAKKLKTPSGYCKEPLSKTECRLLLDCIQASDSSDLIKKRDFAIVNLMIRTGLRLISVQQADIKDIKSKGSSLVLYYLGKGRDMKDDYVVLTEQCARPIFDYLAVSGHQGALFRPLGNRGKKNERISLNNLANLITKYLDRAGIRNKSAHSLRHTAAQLALDNGATPISIRDMLSHRSFDSTLKYIRATDRLGNAAERRVEI